MNGGNLDGRNIRLDSAAQRDRPQGGERGGFGGGNRGSFGGGRGAPRNPGNSTVSLSQDDKNAKKGSIGTFAGKKIALWFKWPIIYLNLFLSSYILFILITCLL